MSTNQELCDALYPTKKVKKQKDSLLTHPPVTGKKSTQQRTKTKRVEKLYEDN